MRVIHFLVLVVLLAACNDSDENNSSASNTSDRKGGDSASLVGVIDGLHTAFKAKSLEQMNNHFAADGMFVGTDPNEFWTRQQLNDYLNLAFKDTTIYRYTISKRVVELGADGNSGVVIDQFTLPFSPHLPIRSIAYAENENGKWSIKMFSWNFIANNDDVDKLNKVVQPPVNQKQKGADTSKVPDAYSQMLR